MTELKKIIKQIKNKKFGLFLLKSIIIFSKMFAVDYSDKIIS